MATFMFFAGVVVEFVKGVEGLVAEFALGVACETSQGDVFDGVARCEVGVEFVGGVEDVFMSKDFFLLGTQ